MSAFTNLASQLRSLVGNGQQYQFNPNLSAAAPAVPGVASAPNTAVPGAGAPVAAPAQPAAAAAPALPAGAVSIGSLPVSPQVQQLIQQFANQGNNQQLSQLGYQSVPGQSGYVSPYTGASYLLAGGQGGMAGAR